MALETATYIKDLNQANPTGSDVKSQGDDHLRLLKAVLRRTFPNLSARLLEPLVKSASYTATLDDNFRSLIFTASSDLTLPDVNGLEGVFCLVVFARQPVIVTPAVGSINNLTSQTLPAGSAAVLIGGGGSYYMFSSPFLLSQSGTSIAGASSMAAVKGMIFPDEGRVLDSDIKTGDLNDALPNLFTETKTFNRPSSIEVDQKGRVRNVVSVSMYDSGLLPIANVTLNTSFSVPLSYLNVTFECLTADGGWAVNDKLVFGGSSVGYTNNTSNNPMTAATRHGFVLNNLVGSVSFYFAGDLYFFTPAGGYHKVTLANWNMRIKGFVL